MFWCERADRCRLHTSSSGLFSLSTCSRSALPSAPSPLPSHCLLRTLSDIGVVEEANTQANSSSGRKKEKGDGSEEGSARQKAELRHSPVGCTEYRHRSRAVKCTESPFRPVSASTALSWCQRMVDDAHSSQ